MKVDKEIKFVQNALQENLDLKGGTFQKELDELYEQFQYLKKIYIDATTANTMYLSLYLRVKNVCYHIRILKAVMQELLVDPLELPYEEYAKKFRELIDDYDWNKHSAVSTIAPLWDGFGLIDGDEYERIFGVNEEELFLPFHYKEKEHRADVSCGTLNGALKTLLANEGYILNAIDLCLEELSDNLHDIGERVEDNRLGSPKLLQELEARKETYARSSKGMEAKEELYNDIRINMVPGMEVQTLNGLKMNLYFNLKRNRLAMQQFKNSNNTPFEYYLYGYPAPLTQAELNEFLRLNLQYELVSKLLDYNNQWKVKENNSIFVNKGTDYIVNALVPHIAEHVEFTSRKSYAALWQALLDLNLLNKTDAKSMMEWINDSFLKDAPYGSGKGEKMKDDKSIREAVDDLYKFQSKDGIQKQFKDFTEEEIPQLKNGEKLKDLYRECVLILAKGFEIDLKEKNFQPYITEYSNQKEGLLNIPKDEKRIWILECFHTNEDSLKH